MRAEQGEGQPEPTTCPFASLRLSSPPALPAQAAAALSAAWGPGFHEAVAQADPLHADALLRNLPRWNAQADVTLILDALRHLLASQVLQSSCSLVDGLAAMRDLGVLLGSLRRHDVEPIEALPACEAPLISLGLRTGMIPRDTVFHYTIWNPPGHRERSYTGDRQETALIVCIRRVIPYLDRAIGLLSDLAATTQLDNTFLHRCLNVESELQGLVQAIVYAQEHVDVRFFAHELRPYFEPILIGGERYLGSAAAHIPLWLIDHLLWASDRSGPELHAFTADAARHALPSWSAIYIEHPEGPSLSSRSLLALAERGEDPLVVAIGHSVYRSMRIILKFRGRHRVLASKAYEPRIRKHPVGSGGYDVVSLDGLLKTTIEAANELRHALARH